MFASGITIGFVGQYVGDVFRNIANKNPDKLQITSDNADFLAAIATGFTGAALDNKLSLLSFTLLLTGVYYSVATSIRKYRDEEVPPGDVLLKNYMRDALVVFFLLYLQKNIYLPYLKAVFGEREISIWGKTLFGGLIITLYYGFRDNFFPPENKTVYEDDKK